MDENDEPTENYFDYEITEVCGKKLLGKIVDRAIKLARHSPYAAEVLDNIKATGYKYLHPCGHHHLRRGYDHSAGK